MHIQTASQDIARLVEFGEGEALADYFRSIPADFASRYGARLERIGSAIVFTIAGLDVPFYSRVIGLGIEEPATPAMLDDIMAFFRRASSPSITVTLSPAAQPPALPDWLQVRGFSPDVQWAQVYRGVEPPPTIRTDLRVECVGPEHRAAFAHVACAAFEMPDAMQPATCAFVGRPGWRHYVAWDGSQPAGAGALFIRGNVGWLGWGGTLEPFRQRGAQGAIMARRIQDGIALGCTRLVAEAVQDTPEHSNPSFHNMVRTGFKLAYLRADYVFRPEPNTV